MATAASIIGVSAIDVGVGLTNDTKPTVLVWPAKSAEGKKHVILLFVGAATPGDTVAKAILPYMGSRTLITVRYPDRGFDPEEIYQLVSKELEKLDQPVDDAAINDKLSIDLVYGQSMGGMVTAEFLRRYQGDGAKWGKVKAVVLDTAPSNINHVKLPWVAKAFASVYPGGPISSKIWETTNRADQKNWAKPGPDSDLALVKEYRDRVAGNPATSTMAQFRFMKGFKPLQPGEFAGVVERTYFVQGQYPDPFIDTERSLPEWGAAFGKIEKIIDESRPEGSHCPSVEHPNEFIVAHMKRALDE